MGTLKNDITGQTFNYLTAIKRMSNQGTTIMFLFKCICGNKKVMSAKKVRYGSTKSCGCMKIELCRKGRTIHGHAAKHKKKSGKTNNGSITYKTFHNMHERCYKKTHVDYDNYGGRGIKVCQRWQGKNGFINFLLDMKEKPEGYEIDRYPNNDGDYEPNNCRWATPSQNSCNRRTNIKIYYKQKIKTISEWSILLDIPYDALQVRLKRGWSNSKALETPLYKKRRMKFYFHPHLIRLRSIIK